MYRGRRGRDRGEGCLVGVEDLRVGRIPGGGKGLEGTVLGVGEDCLLLDGRVGRRYGLG
jgi:hypothetical protein